MNGAELIGTWTLTGFTLTDPDGENFKPWGDQISGLLIYTADGYVSGILGPTEPNLNRPGGGYSGTFEVYGNEVHHHVLASGDPNLIGTRQVRGVQIDGDELILTSQLSMIFGEGHSSIITWRRAGLD